ncbi:hypothetical protein [Methanobacterium oryzae]|uniref:hypothetical protein n=1 Tax=Methanobacterium oryzae TaxID=69540 RepID=UPI003D2082C0
MFKTSRNSSINLKRRNTFINLKQFNPQSFAIIAMILMILVISILCVAAYPNSNMPMNF